MIFPVYNVSEAFSRCQMDLFDATNARIARGDGKSATSSGASATISQSRAGPRPRADERLRGRQSSQCPSRDA